MVSDEFLERYRVLEDLLSERYGGAPRRHASVIMEFADSKEGEIFRDRLDLCREIRNLLTHNAALNGEPVVDAGARHARHAGGHNRIRASTAAGGQLGHQRRQAAYDAHERTGTKAHAHNGKPGLFACARS